MIPFPEPNKTSPKSDANGHSQPGTPTIVQIPAEPNPDQQQADLGFNKPQEQPKNLVKDEQRINQPKFPRHKSRGLSLKTKVTALAIALGTLPVIGIGAIAYYFADRAVVNQISPAKQARAVELANQINYFMYDRYGDIQVMSSLPILENPKLRAASTLQQKEAALNRFLDAYLLYDSIAVADLAGNTIVQSLGETVTGLGERDYFKEVIKTNNPVVTPPRKSALTGKYSIFTAAPIVDTATGKTIGVIRARIPINRVEEVVQKFGNDQDEYIVTDSSGNIFLAGRKDDLGKNAQKLLPGFAQLQALGRPNTRILTDAVEQERLVAYSPVEKLPGMPELGWNALIATDTAIAYAPQKQLLLTLMLGTGLTALLISALAAYLANRATRPILAASNAIKKLGQGELETRIAVKGQDELAVLGSNINQMAGKLQTALQAQIEQARRKERYDKQAQLYTEVASYRVNNFQDLEPVYNKAIQGAREILETDRVVVYRFNPDKSGYVSAESVAPGWPRALEAKFPDPCFIEGNYVERYRTGRVKATANIYEAGLSECYIKQLEPFAVKANLVAPILRNEQLFGLLIAHQCSEPRDWQQYEISFLTELASKVGLAIDRVDALEQQKAGKEQLQKRALELLMEVDPLSKGDLTIRATVTDDEIGTVADSYNSTISSLRKIVTQVQAAAKQVTASTSSSEVSVQELSAEALRQTAEISSALDQIQEMSNSIRAVATNAEQAETAVQLSTQTVEAGDAAMNRTVKGIGAIRDTVAETSIKVKRLGESSQKISKVVKLISSFADQTNLLALNAAIEAARAGEQGLGFAVVADEVQALALQSAEATAEIQGLVTEIQAETNEVVAAMEAGTEQVAEGTRLVDETRLSLNQITAVSNQISTLVKAIASATITQSQASESVTHTMTDVAAIANQTSTEATQVSASFKELLVVAKELQASAGQFKVN
ncbi:MAG: HAMP domain-containing protein [Gloeocapsa sp. UFS-A4-WI-NPMV-4B04]|jgi:methyl-accepting chemotaxis protein|nr:HAMP domain-containing protein [Gloeocapsa sp. UFS-A4-WI-NPMV-4B04]